MPSLSWWPWLKGPEGPTTAWFQMLWIWTWMMPKDGLAWLSAPVIPQQMSAWTLALSQELADASIFPRGSVWAFVASWTQTKLAMSFLIVFGAGAMIGKGCFGNEQQRIVRSYLRAAAWCELEDKEWSQDTSKTAWAIWDFEDIATTAVLGGSPPALIAPLKVFLLGIPSTAWVTVRIPSPWSSTAQLRTLQRLLSAVATKSLVQSRSGSNAWVKSLSHVVCILWTGKTKWILRQCHGHALETRRSMHNSDDSWSEH